MEQSLNYQKEKVLSLCCPHDYDLLTGAIPMNIQDYERLTYIIMSLGYSSYLQAIDRQFPVYSTILAEQADREVDILVENPEYYADENMYEKFDKWIQDFLSHIPCEERAYYQELIKLNIE